MGLLDEGQLRRDLAEQFQQNIIGISVCWEFKGLEDQLCAVLEHSLHELQSHHEQGDIDNCHENNSKPPIIFRKVDELLGYKWPFLDETKFPLENKVRRTLLDLKTTDKAFVIFESQAARDA